ncbi:hypothetical protein [Demequina phytophila]|uniref:hypothetical protein n=1 Tax=Demequina phytophila TaxID=1638981 RepID=UPI000B179BB7|nr:hypothetical protein [Demequina phytophila]
MSTLTRRWFAFIRVEDRSGASAALTGVFSERGVSFGSLSTLDVHAGVGTLCVEFAASERLAQVLVRTLARLAVVRDVDLVRADDARVRAVAILPGGVAPGDPGEGVDAWADPAGDLTVLSGTVAAVESAVARLRAGGRPPVAVSVLPPR